MRRLALVSALAALFVLIAAPAVADKGKPDFSPHVYADGDAWSTKVTTELPAPNGNNAHSFDKFFVFTNGADGQLPVGEAAPGRDYNGGRWVTWTATWEDDVPHDIIVLMSYEDVMFHYGLGHLSLTKGSPEGGPPDYFQCPLLPVK